MGHYPRLDVLNRIHIEVGEGDAPRSDDLRNRVHLATSGQSEILPLLSLRVGMIRPPTDSQTLDEACRH
jgi:hypothetical protein